MELDEDDFRALLQDMALLSDECRHWAAKLKGHKGAVESTSAWESIKQAWRCQDDLRHYAAMGLEEEEA